MGLGVQTLSVLAHSNHSLNTQMLLKFGWQYRFVITLTGLNLPLSAIPYS